MLARYDGEPRVLDIGYAFAEPAYLAGCAASARRISSASTSRGRCRARRGRRRARRCRSTTAASTSSSASRRSSTSAATTTVYDVDAPRDEHGDEAALRELRRVLASDGRLLVTVPTGVHDDQGWQVQRTPGEWIALFERAGFLVFEDELYVRGDDGWRTRVARRGAQRARTRDHGAGAVLLAELRPGTVGGKLRLAVRDVRHRDDIRRSTRCRSRTTREREPAEREQRRQARGRAPRSRRAAARYPAAMKPSGPAIVATVITAVITFGRSSAGVRTVSIADHRRVDERREERERRDDDERGAPRQRR